MAGDTAAPRVKAGERNVLVTSALPYVNNVPHLGNLIGAVLSADVYARYLRQRGVNCVYVCGTDEYGTATETKAQQEGVMPSEICDHYFKIHSEIYEWFDISFDHFGRTSKPYQTQIVQDIFRQVNEKGMIQKGELEQLFCERDKRFLADRFVRGTCPQCTYEDARGDQCEHCGRMLNPSELIRPKCSTCGSEPVSRTSKHLFLDLTTIQSRLERWVEETSKRGDWNSNCIAMTQSWLRDGLKPRCITRDLKWGVPVPLEGYTDKVFYVWFDAPIGYISITAELMPEHWKEWWQNPRNVELVQFMGKDNVPFHTIVFPSALLATEQEWTMVHHLSTTEYLNYESGKFSKSKGVGVFGNDAKNTGIGVEVWRYYLMSNRPEGADSVFLWSDFQAKNNTELLNNVGNFCNRAITFVSKFFDGEISAVSLSSEDERFLEQVNEALNAYIKAFDKVQLKSALRHAMTLSSHANTYMQHNEPWKHVKVDKPRAASVVSLSCNVVLLLNALLEPFLGTRFSNKVLGMLGLSRDARYTRIPDTFSLMLETGHKIGSPELLFSTIDDKTVAALKLKFAGAQDDSTRIGHLNITDAGSVGAAAAAAAANAEGAFQLDLRVGRIVEVRESADSDKLYVGKVDVGEGESGGANAARNFVAGLRDLYKLEELQGRTVVVVCNLQPVQLGGIESQAMLLTAEKKKSCVLLEVAPECKPGDQVATMAVPYVRSALLLDRKGFQNASKPFRVGASGKVFFQKEFELGVLGADGAFYPISAGDVGEGGKLNFTLGAHARMTTVLRAVRQRLTFLERLQDFHCRFRRQVFVKIIVDLDHGCVDASPKALHLHKMEKAVWRIASHFDSQVLFTSFEHFVAAANHTWRRSAHLDVVFPDFLAIIHGVECSHLVDTHRRHLKNVCNLIHGSQGKPSSALSLRKIERGNHG
ncbi:putative methionine--tRNA ligase [Porphyridium purpureum]|uniref:methionine--tRNA ligase n=1 Tax=Porphyridium purpureum TaxID=35688 RepID=A0A5J4YXP0_PORPP|nr:putative methionine--tRNA ligase [Porphyridium purpureum]|eukprot:POR2672..scf209_3